MHTCITLHPIKLTIANLSTAQRLRRLTIAMSSSFILSATYKSCFRLEICYLHVDILRSIDVQ